jgi:DNA polymerase III alpha subunit
LIDISAITSIYRPGPLGADVDKSYVAAKRDPGSVKYVNKLVKDVTKETYGFLIFQNRLLYWLTSLVKTFLSTKVMLYAST